MNRQPIIDLKSERSNQPKSSNATFFNTLDAYHPHATRYVLISNLKINCTPFRLRQVFGKFGQIIKLFIENNEDSNSTCVIEYLKNSSAVEAINRLNGKITNISNGSICIEFWETITTNCLILHNIKSSVDYESLKKQCCTLDNYQDFDADHKNKNCLVTYDSIDQAKQAHSFLKGINMRTKQMQIDFASMDCINSINRNSIKNLTALHFPADPVSPSSTVDSGFKSVGDGSPNQSNTEDKTIEQIDAELLDIDSLTSFIDFVYGQDNLMPDKGSASNFPPCNLNCNPSTNVSSTDLNKNNLDQPVLTTRPTIISFPQFTKTSKLSIKLSKPASSHDDQPRKMKDKSIRISNTNLLHNTNTPKGNDFKTKRVEPSPPEHKSHKRVKDISSQDRPSKRQRTTLENGPIRLGPHIDPYSQMISTIVNRRGKIVNPYYRDNDFKREQNTIETKEKKIKIHNIKIVNRNSVKKDDKIII